MPFTITGNEIDFRGTSRFTGGTGAYRGITSGALTTRDHNTLDGQNGTLSVDGLRDVLTRADPAEVRRPSPRTSFAGTAGSCGASGTGRPVVLLREGVGPVLRRT